MKILRSRKKTLLFIILLWVVLFLAIFQVSRVLYTSGFHNLEINFARESNQRAYQAMLFELNHIYLLNLDYAYWNETYEYVQNRNKKYADSNLVKDLFVDNKINYVILFDKSKKVIWGKAYSLIKSDYMALPPFLANTTLDILAVDIQKQYRAYDVSQGIHGLAGFYLIPQNGEVIYLAINEIKDLDVKKPSMGFLVFAKILDERFFKYLSGKIDYPVTFSSISGFLQDPGHMPIYDYIKHSDRIYIDVLNDQYLRSYRLFKDLVGRPIGVLSVDLSRKLYLESEKASRENQFIIFIVSLCAISFMLTIVYLFFRQQDIITRAFEQFFPKDFIRLLKKEDILSIALGDHVEKEISVLFMDIRNFTNISESMTPAENFQFINQVLAYIAPTVSANNGFIDKYIGDAVMALFSSPKTHADDAVKAALMMIETLKDLNELVGVTIQHEVSIGVGINSGKLMLGIIGAGGRFEGTAISDTVNTASRIESATRTYNKLLLISQDTLDRLHHQGEYSIEFIDELMAKGKSKKVNVYSVSRK